MIEWASTLTDIGLDVPIENQFNIKCPFHEDRVDSCSINTDKGVWICFAGCGQGSLYSFLMKYLHIGYDEAQQIVIQSQANFDIDIFDDLIPIAEDMPEVSFPAKQGFVPEWVFDRGFTKKTLGKWGCGIDVWNGLVIPIEDKNSKLVGWVTRKEFGSPKYLYSKGLKKSKLLFGQQFLQAKKPFVCITEGTLDTMWLDQNGFSSVAILGAILSKSQELLCSSLQTEELVLCLDNDEAGQIGLARAMGCLNKHFVVSYIEIPKEYKDVQDIRDKNELESILQNRNIF